MPINPNVNAMLKEMWRLKEKIDSREEPLSISERKYWSDHLILVVDYYNTNANDWTKVSTEFTYKTWSHEERHKFFTEDQIN